MTASESIIASYAGPIVTVANLEFDFLIPC